MHSIIVLLGCLLMVRAEVPYHPAHYGVLPYRTAAVHPVDESPKPYQFAYHAEAIGGSSARQEVADGSGRVVGSYSLNDEDGRSRVVDYVADEAGFRASVKTNEPGTKSESPADVPTISSASDSVAGSAPLHHYGAYHGRSHPYSYGLGYGGYGLGYGGLGGGYSGLGYGRYRGLGYYGGLGYGGHYPYGHHYGYGHHRYW